MQLRSISSKSKFPREHSDVIFIKNQTKSGKVVTKYKVFPIQLNKVQSRSLSIRCPGQGLKFAPALN